MVDMLETTIKEANEAASGRFFLLEEIPIAAEFYGWSSNFYLFQDDLIPKAKTKHNGDLVERANAAVVNEGPVSNQAVTVVHRNQSGSEIFATNLAFATDQNE